MADAAEDVLVHQDAEPADPEDEVAPDFRYLKTQKIPSRGMKDFEPHGTNLQDNTLEASRHAMQVAIDQTRFHNRDVQRAIFDPETGGAWVTKAGGKWNTTVGRARKPVDLDGVAEKGKPARLWLMPEEALWLLDRGSLDVRWPAVEGEDDEEGLPMSVQGAYAAFIGDGGRSNLTMDQYSVYSYLKRAGYIVLRADDNLHNVPAATGFKQAESSGSAFWSVASILWSTTGTKGAPHKLARQGPLTGPGHYRSYNDIFDILSIVPYHDPRQTSTTTPAKSTEPVLKVTYHVYKTATNYKKTDPGPPDFYICVMNARETSVPSEQEINDLLLQTPYHAPDPKMNMYKKIKDGYRNVILCVIDQGITSFLNVADAGFGNVPIRDYKPAAGTGKGKGGGKFAGKRR